MIQKSIIVLLFACIVTITNAQKPVQMVLPKTEFDIKQATEMLNNGNSEIRGLAFIEDRTPIGIKVGETIYARTGSIIRLFPITAYLQEYLELKKKNKPNKRIAAISPLAWSYRIEAKVYGTKGEFVFKGLKPGRYYLEAVVHYPIGSTSREVDGIVEITKDGESLDYKLKDIF